jgi:hypothetical protein
MSNPVHLLAQQRIISASAELEVQLSHTKGARPTVEILNKLRETAAEALEKLVYANVFTHDGRAELVTMQNKVKRYYEFFDAMKAVLNEGKALDYEMTEASRQELVDQLSGSREGNQELIELGMLYVPPDSAD